mgnify:CR=1 FL=1
MNEWRKVLVRVVQRCDEEKRDAKGRDELGTVEGRLIKEGSIYHTNNLPGACLADSQCRLSIGRMALSLFG